MKHEPHRLHVVACKPPIATGVEISQSKVIGKPQLHTRDPVGHLTGDELQPAPGRFVIEENARAGEEAVALPIVHGDVVTVDLGDPVRAARVERGALPLRDFAHLAEHLAGRRLVESDRGIGEPDRFENAGHTYGVEFRGQNRLRPGCRNKGHRGQVVDLVRLDPLDHIEQRILIEEVGLLEPDLLANVIDPREILRARSPDRARDPIALLQQEFGEVRAVLPGYPRDQSGTLSHLPCPPMELPALLRHAPQSLCLGGSATLPLDST